MRVVIDRGSASVNSYGFGLDGFEFFCLAGKSIEQFEHELILAQNHFLCLNTAYMTREEMAIRPRIIQNACG